MTLIELALAFVISHPAVTAAIIGPRTMEQLESQLPPPTSRCRTRCSTRSTRSSRPGSNVNPADEGWQNPALRALARRR